MCQGCADGALDEASIRRLENYAWSEAEHEALFRALAGAPAAPAVRLREWLPARLTRLGFPDFDCEDLFLPLGLKKRDVEQMIAELLSS